MNLAPRLYRALPPAALVLACGACSAAGLALTASADGYAQVVLGYGVLFGLGAGIAFTLMQQSVNAVLEGPGGAINGYVVSLYPLGAMIGAPVFGWSIVAYGLRPTLAALAAVVLATCACAAALLRHAAIDLRPARAAPARAHDPQWPVFLRLSAVFFLAAAAGLMVMSQAAGIVQAYGGQTALAVGATTFITGAIAAARFGGGWLVDRFSVPHVAAFAHLWSFTGAVALTLWPGPLVAVPALAMIGMGYGFVSGLTAAAIARYWNRAQFGTVVCSTLHRLVRCRGQPAGARGLAVRPDPGLRRGGDDRGGREHRRHADFPAPARAARRRLSRPRPALGPACISARRRRPPAPARRPVRRAR